MKLKFYLWSLLAMFACSMATVGCSDDDDVVTPPMENPDDNEGDVQPEPQPENALDLKLAFNLSEITAENATIEITPADNAIAYYAMVAPAAEIAKLSDAVLIERDMKTLDKAKLMKGIKKMSASYLFGKLLNAETEYVVYAFGVKEGFETTTVSKKSFSTLEPVAGPEVEFVAGTGFDDGSFKDALVWINARCTSGDASAVSLFMDEFGMIAKEMEQGVDHKNFLEKYKEYVEALPEDVLEGLNLRDIDMPNGLHMEIAEVLDDNNYAFLIDVRNAKGGRTVKFAETKTDKGNITVLNDQRFCEQIWDFTKDETLKFKGERPVVLEFFASWCGPCYEMAPMIAEMKEDYKGMVDFFKVNIELAPKAFELFAMEDNMDGNIPYQVMIKPGNEKYSHVGPMREDDMRNKIDEFLLDGNGIEEVAAPNVKVHGYTMEKDGQQVLVFNCKSDSAEKARLGLYDKTETDKFLLSGGNLRNLVKDPQASQELPQNLFDAMLTPEGADLAFQLGGDTRTFTFLLYVKNKTPKSYTIIRMDRSINDPEQTIEKQGNENDVVNSEVTIIGICQGNVINYAMFCLSHDATKVNYITTSPEELQKQFDQGYTLDQVMDTEYNLFTDEWLKEFNSDAGLVLALEDVNVGEVYTLVLDVRNARNGRTIKRCNVDTDIPEMKSAAPGKNFAPVENFAAKYLTWEAPAAEFSADEVCAAGLHRTINRIKIVR